MNSLPSVRLFVDHLGAMQVPWFLLSLWRSQSSNLQLGLVLLWGWLSVSTGPQGSLLSGLTALALHPGPLGPFFLASYMALAPMPFFSLGLALEGFSPHFLFSLSWVW